MANKLFGVVFVALAIIVGTRALQNEIFTMEDGHTLPLVGLGVGNLGYDLIEQTIEQACQKHSVSFIDTAAASNNYQFIKAALENVQLPVQVQSKIWYTYLGKERTKLSLKATLDELKGVDVTILIHWPRCRNDIPWMRCVEEEEALAPQVKAVGPPPHLDQDAWIGSWEALEESYLRGDVKAIGVSNFDSKELAHLLSISTVKPHILQGNVWSVLYDPQLMKLCRENNILFQAYNVMNGFMSQDAIQRVPRAVNTLNRLAQQFSKVDNVDSQCGRWAQAGECQRNPAYMSQNCPAEYSNTVFPSQLLLRWLTQENVAVIPRASSLPHLEQNSPTSIARVPLLSEQQMYLMRQLAEALISGRDLEKEVGVVATFINKHEEGHGSVKVFWVNEDTGEEVLTGQLNSGEEANVETHPGHVFLVRSKDGSFNQKYHVTSTVGTQHFHIGGEL